MDRTFVIIKPDAVERGLTGEIIARFERKGLRVVALELRTIDEVDRWPATTPSTRARPSTATSSTFIGRSPAVRWCSRARRTRGRSCGR